MAGGETAVAGGEIALAGGGMALAGSKMAVGGGETALAGGAMALAGGKMALGGGKTALAGQWRWRTRSGWKARRPGSGRGGESQRARPIPNKQKGGVQAKKGTELDTREHAFLCGLARKGGVSEKKGTDVSQESLPLWAHQEEGCP